ncbi:MAG: DUF3794 domain-containing protein [Lachnospiraceae bacterium]|nr:DUF3794 domain-containing protein [Lachnospiraceae bacterium]
MELIKKDIHMNQVGSKQELQVTLDYDFNVPDIKPDVDKIVRQQGSVVIGDTKASQNKLIIDGNLEFSVLYVSFNDGRMVHGITGKLPFNESILWDEVIIDEINVKPVLEDLTVILVNSRKLSIRCIVSFVCEEARQRVLSVGIDVEHNDEEGFNLEKRKKLIDISRLKVSTKDIFRVKEELALNTLSHNIEEIMYSDVVMENYDVRLMSGQININGNLSMFALYSCENGEIEYMDKEISFDGNIEVPGVDDNMIEDVEITIQSFEINVRPDADRENRIVEVDTVLLLNIKAYEDEQLDILLDCYSTKMGVVIEREDVIFENIAMKNTNKFRVVDKMELAVGEPAVLLICKSIGEIKVDGIEIINSGVKVWGAVEITVLYVSGEDRAPINSVKGVFPYSQTIEMSGIDSDSIVKIRGCVDSTSVIVIDAKHLEIKAQISLGAIAFNLLPINIITKCEINEESYINKTALPGIIGYFATEGENMWDVAKRFNTTMDNIKKVNNLDRDILKDGERLIIVTE